MAGGWTFWNPGRVLKVRSDGRGLGSAGSTTVTPEVREAATSSARRFPQGLPGRVCGLWRGHFGRCVSGGETRWRSGVGKPTDLSAAELYGLQPRVPSDFDFFSMAFQPIVDLPHR